jgi:hypothetical protein
MNTETHKHGEYGERHTTVNIGTASMTQVWGNARWCEKCAGWKWPGSVVSLVLSSFCCPTCKTPWEPK